MMRSSVVLPQPEGPSSATSSPVGKSRLTSPSAVKLPNDLWMLRTWMLMSAAFWARCGRPRQDAVEAAAATDARHSMNCLIASVTSASIASSEATANAAANWYSL